MPPRPVLKLREGRPVSAVFIGKGSGSNINLQEPSQSSQLSSDSLGTPPNIPELPSPSSSVDSGKSGLPSPPATNSTGSGSTGDPATIVVRNRPLSLHSNSSTSTSSGSHSTVATPIRRSLDAASSSRSSSRSADLPVDDSAVDGDFDDDHDKENDLENNVDGDDTARLDLKHLVGLMDKSNTSSENKATLQRAQSLAQRNRLALDKLSRLSSPSPARSGTPNSRSPALSQGSFRSQTSRAARALPPVPQQRYNVRSGSETERESSHHSQTHGTPSSSSHSHSVSSIRRSISHSSHSQRSTTPPSSQSHGTSPQASPYSRFRHISAPASPQKARAIVASTSSGSNSSHSPSHRRRNRASIASVVQLTDFEEEEEGLDVSNIKSAVSMARERRDKTINEADVITQSARAAVASSRRSPLGHRRRSALPREFRSDLVEAVSTVGAKRESIKSGMEPLTPLWATVNGAGRPSTVRERHSVINPHWLSGDYRTPATTRNRSFNPSFSNEDGNPRRERRQNVRGGSVESALWSPGGRSLVGEGLRAAGLTRRKDDESRVKAQSSKVEAPSNGDVFKERERRVDWSPEDEINDSSRRALVVTRPERKLPPRASTSMAQYQYLDRDLSGYNQEHERGLWGHRSAPVPADQQRDSIISERATSALSRHTSAFATGAGTPRLAVAHFQERCATASPFGSRRYGGQPPPTPQTEHARLMLDSLAIFENTLARAPRSSASNSSAGPLFLSSHVDVLQNAQGMVHAADQLCNLLKQGSARAVEAQVEAEVESASHDLNVKQIVDMWGKMGADYREGSKMADDLIRGITGVLLGTGRLIREIITTERGASMSEFGSPSVHGRHASLGNDDIGVHVNSAGAGSSNGRQSVSSRHSWDPPRDRDREREETCGRLAGTSNTVRPDSILARVSPATFQRLNSLEQQLQTPSPAPNGRNPLSHSSAAAGAGSVRRSLTPREQRELEMLDTRGGNRMMAIESQETIHPSPTPASRQRLSPNVDRPHTLPPLTIPRPLPTLPSETLLRRTADKFFVDKELSRAIREQRRRGTRANERPVFPLTSPANATIALTPHTVSNVERSQNLLQRTDSSKSEHSKVTFSRPTAVSVSQSLSELQQADGERLRTLSTNAEGDDERSGSSKQNHVGLISDVIDKRKTLGVTKSRMSLEHYKRSPQGVSDNLRTSSHAADRSAASTILAPAGKRDRRRTVTDIWPK